MGGDVDRGKGSRTREAAPRAGKAGDAAKLRRSGAGYPKVVDRLVDEFAKLPGVGRRSAERLAFHILKAEAGEALDLARAIDAVKQSVRHCAVCGHLTDASDTPGDAALCSICTDPARDRSSVLVVEQPKDLIALEQTGVYRGLYHVLLGRLSPLDGIGIDELNWHSLFRRIAEPSGKPAGAVDLPAGDETLDPPHPGNPGGVQVREVILGLNPTLEGDGTGLLLTQQIQALAAEQGDENPVRVTRLARGLPTGSQLEYANKAVLADAIQSRQ
ncbi:MAG: toprim domain-containing protein [Planctomycetota bacterium]|nr:toprim domain-containing protein [Planctomycetota bacterium]